jgi:hypothetical protein
MNNLQVNDVGTTFILTIKERDPDNPDSLIVVNIAAAASMAVKFKKPDGTVISRTGTLYGSGTDGKMKYTTVSGDIDQAGRWSIQAAATIGGWIGRSDIHQFVVRQNVS